jgi:hypothetical protein
MTKRSIDIKEMTADVIDRARNLQEFEVLRDIEDVPFSGEFKYTVRHRHGEPARILVHAISQAEAEARVDEWIGSLS